MVSPGIPSVFFMVDVWFRKHHLHHHLFSTVFFQSVLDASAFQPSLPFLFLFDAAPFSHSRIGSIAMIRLPIYTSFLVDGRASRINRPNISVLDRRKVLEWCGAASLELIPCSSSALFRNLSHYLSSGLSLALRLDTVRLEMISLVCIRSILREPQSWSSSMPLAL